MGTVPGGRGRRRGRPPERAPLPDRDGVPPMRFRLPGDGSFGTVADFLVQHTRNAPGVRRRLDAGEVLLADGTVVLADTPYQPGAWVYLHRDLPVEAEVPGELTVLYQDDDLVVVDKPHFLATTPRGRHVTQSVLVRLRRHLGLPDLAPAHRLDRLTAGVLLLTVRPAIRGAYQELFARREVAKSYLALASMRPDLVLPTTVRSRIVKRRGTLQAVEVPGAPNAETRLELVDTLRLTGSSGVMTADHVGRYRLTPLTGRTHQLRVHLAGLGIPILGDPLYPRLRDHPGGHAGGDTGDRAGGHAGGDTGDRAGDHADGGIGDDAGVGIGDGIGDDFAHPLQLLAHRLEFTDPLTGAHRCFTSERRLPCFDG